MCTAKYLSNANHLKEASKHLLNKKQTGEQQSTSQPVKQSTNQPTSQSTNQPTIHPISQQPNQPNNVPRRTTSVNANAAGKDKYSQPSLMYEH
jgi:hypothetical protein